MSVSNETADVVRLADVNLFDPAFHTGDPHPLWRVMRERAPLHRQVLADGRAFWNVTRYHDVCRVLGNHRQFTSERGSLLSQLGTVDAAAGRMLVSTDPPRHLQLRRPLASLFAQPAAEALRGRIRHGVRGLFSAAPVAGSWDLAVDVQQLPLVAAAAVMDLPESDWPDLIRWTGMAAAPSDPEFSVGSTAATLAIAHHELFDYFAGQVRGRREHPGDDVISHLLSMQAGDGLLTREEVIFNCYSILLGANATTPHTVSGTVLALVERPGLLSELTGHPEAAPDLVEEGLRWTSAASSFLRHAVVDTELSGGMVRAGEAVAAWVGAANRDSRIFPDPDRFDPARRNNRHIAFGHGPHYCLGATLARVTLQEFFAEFLETCVSIQLAGQPRRLASNFIAGLTHLPLSVRRRA